MIAHQSSTEEPHDPWKRKTKEPYTNPMQAMLLLTTFHHKSWRRWPLVSRHFIFPFIEILILPYCIELRHLQVILLQLCNHKTLLAEDLSPKKWTSTALPFLVGTKLSNSVEAQQSCLVASPCFFMQFSENKSHSWVSKYPIKLQK